MLSPRNSQAPSGRSRHLIPLEYVEAYIFRAVDLCKDGEVKGAIATLGKALSLDPESEPALVLRAGFWMSPRKPRKAIGDLSKAIIVNCCNPDAYYLRAQAYQSLGCFRAAITDYSRVLRLEAGNRDALVNRALLYWYLGQLDRAIPDFNTLGVPAPRIVKALANWSGMNFAK